MRLIQTVIIVFLQHLCCQANIIPHSNHSEYSLFEKLFPEENDYNSVVRPKIGNKEPVLVNVSVNLIAIHSLMETRQTLRSTVWIDLQWLDLKLAWNKTEFGNISSIIVPQKNVWIPDICVANEVSDNKCSIGSRFGKVLVEYRGMVTIWWNKEIQTRCDLDISMYPFDNQKCSIRIGTLYSEDENLLLGQLSETVDLSNYAHNEEWKIIHSFTKKKKLEHEKSFTEIEFTIVMKRQPFFHICNTILPILMLSVLNMVCFLVPIESGEKINMTMAIFLTFAVLMTIISETVPKSGEKIFVFGICMTMHLLISGITIVLEVFVINIYHTPGNTKMNVLHLWMLKILAVKDDIAKEIDSILETEEKQMDSWKRLATELDRVFGYTVAVINSVTIIAFFVAVNTQ
ncbi:acetylcholine receptor subunit alpha-like [Ostrea edulis]|uniref:acetylcholine receptor subunit alpha-like n=1 Tax=Ostrea edulis TaxID=37623 RepID=UPI0024AF219D|nr:acetylcholine receptor subunit alpha-like [Ostrea edulis]